MPRFELETLASLMTGVIGYPHKYNALPLSYTGLSDWIHFEIYHSLMDLVIGSRRRYHATMFIIRPTSFQSVRD